MILNTSERKITQGFVSMYDANTGYSGLIGALLPLLDDAFGRKSKMNLAVGSEDPSIFELDAVVNGSVSSFLDWRSFEGNFLICLQAIHILLKILT